MMVGLLSLVAYFMLIMVADNGRDILINFTAVEFISYLDDTVFILGAVTEVFMLRASSRYENSRYVSTTFPDYVCLLFVFYSLAKWGYFGDEVNNKSRQICKAKYLDLFFGASTNNRTKTFLRRKVGNNFQFPRSFFLLCVFGIIIICWGMILYKQETG